MAAFAALLVLPQGSQAQARGGSGHSSSGFSGGHSGFSRPAVAHSGSGISRPASHSSSFAPQNRSGFAPRRFATNGFDRGFDRRFGRGFDRGFDHFHHRFADPFLFSGGCIYGNFFGGFPCSNFLFGDSFVWGYAPFGASYPFGYDYSGYNSGYNNPPPPPQQTVVEQSGNDNQLAYEVGRLSGEVEELRSEQARPQGADGQPSQGRRPRSSDSAIEPTTNATLVFRDGKKMSVENYAIVGQTLWVLSSRTARKIPLSDLDLPATKQVNEDNGTEIHLPANLTP